MGRPGAKALVAALAMCVALAFYAVLVASHAILLIRTGTVPGIGIGVSLLVLPVVVLWWMVRQWTLAVTVQRMADTLEREGGLPRVEGAQDARGRLEPDVAEAFFASAKAQAEESPEDWKAWYRVAFAYDANRDRTMAQRSLAHAAALFRRRSPSARSATAPQE